MPGIGIGLGVALAALGATGSFTVIAFVTDVVDTGRGIGAVLGSNADPAATLILKANGRRAGFYYSRNDAGNANDFDYPWSGPDLLSIAQVSDAAYPFRAAGHEALTRLYLNGGCIHSGTGQQVGLGDGLALFGIQNGYSPGNFAGRYYGHLVFDRALSPAEVKQVHQWFCEHTGQTTPWARAAATCSVFGNSLDDGLFVAALEYTPLAIAAAINCYPLGTWDNPGVNSQSGAGLTRTVADEIVPIAAATSRPHRTLVGEYYNAAWSDGHARFDAFVAAILASPADAIVRIDQDPHIGRGGSVADATYYQGNRLHLTGTAGASGYRAKAALIAAAFAAWSGG